ncbi:MAG TPA: hypothetical protein VKV37_11955 [Ktedonobacteraceae bacterium]|jgi:hypothetical protein|nr:hypothetical protein [Ktedonobacteraceae bacterium]
MKQQQRKWRIFKQGRTTLELSISILVFVALLSGVAGIWIGLMANIPMLIALVVASILVWRTTLKHKVTRIALFVIAAFIGVSAIQGGIALLQGALDQWVQLSWLAGTPFSDYTVPGLVLVIVVGGTGLLAAATVFIQREWAVLVSGLAGLLMAGYEVVEIISIDSKLGNALPTALGLQLVYFVLGLVVFGLAGSLWMREYRRQHFHHLRHVSHA